MVETLSALALVAQGCIPEHAKNATQNAVLQASIERQKLELENVKLRFDTQTLHHKMRMQDLNEALYLIEVIEQQRKDNVQYIDYLRDKKRLIKLKYKHLQEETGKQYHNTCFLEHTTPRNTEAHDRQAFIQSNFKAPAATSIEIS